MAEEENRKTPDEGVTAILRVSDDWAGRALEVARGQAAVPDSPGRRSEDGAVALCAAACVAHAGLELRYGADRAEAFRADVGTTGSKRLVVDAFERLGLDGDACAYTMAVNDRTAPAGRIDALARLLARRPAPHPSSR